MNEPRPAMISARPPESRSSVAKSWKTRTGSSELSTVTALVSRMRFVRAPRRAEHDRGRRDGEVRPVVLADAEDVEPDLVGELDLLHQIAQPLRRVGAGTELRERVDPDLHAGALYLCGRESPWLLKDVDRARDDQADRHQRDDRLHAHQLFALGVSGMVSVGLNAAALVSET